MFSVATNSKLAELRLWSHQRLCRSYISVGLGLVMVVSGSAPGTLYYCLKVYSWFLHTLIFPRNTDNRVCHCIEPACTLTSVWVIDNLGFSPPHLPTWSIPFLQFGSDKSVPVSTYCLLGRPQGCHSDEWKGRNRQQVTDKWVEFEKLTGSISGLQENYRSI